MRATLTAPPSPWIHPSESKEPQPATRRDGAAGRRGSLAGRCTADPEGSLGMRVQGIRPIAHPGVRKALARGAQGSFKLTCGNEVVEVQVRRGRVDVVLGREDLRAVYGEDFVAAREVLTLQSRIAPLCTEVTSELAVTTTDGARQQVDRFDKRPSAPLVRLLGTAGLFTDEFVGEASRHLAEAAQPRAAAAGVAAQAVAVNFTEGLAGIALHALRNPGDYFAWQDSEACMFVAYAGASRELWVQYAASERVLPVSLCTFKLAPPGSDAIVGVESNPSFDAPTRLRMLRESGVLRPDAPAQLAAWVAAQPPADSKQHAS